VSFVTHSQVTREAIEAATPKLRDALAAHGYSNVNVDVSQQQFRDRAAQPRRYEPEFSFAAAATGSAGSAAAVASTARPQPAGVAGNARGATARIDTYA